MWVSMLVISNIGGLDNQRTLSVNLFANARYEHNYYLGGRDNVSGRIGNCNPRTIVVCAMIESAESAVPNALSC